MGWGPGDTASWIAIASPDQEPKTYRMAPGHPSRNLERVCATLEVRVSQIAGEPGNQDFVEVRLPAAGAYLSVLRTATAGLAARLDFTLDEIEDLRIAVDEACAILLQQAVPGSVLSCVFRLVDDSLEVTVAAPTTDGRAPERDTFAWTVLSALVSRSTPRSPTTVRSVSACTNSAARDPPM